MKICTNIFNHTPKTRDDTCEHGGHVEFVVHLATENLGASLPSSQAGEIQRTKEHASGVHFEQRGRDDTGPSLLTGDQCTRDDFL